MSQVGRPRRRRELRESEIEDFRVAVGTQHDVLGLDIAVHETAGMRRRQSTCELDADLDNVADRQRALLQAVPQRLALDELGDEVRTVIDFAEIVYHDDMRVVQTGRGSGFLMKPSEPIAVNGEMRRQELERHRPIELGVVGQIHLAHAARAQPRHQLIGVHDPATQVFTDVWLEHQHGRGLQEGLDTIACTQQSIDPRAQHRVGSAGFGKIRLAFRAFARQRAFEDALHARPIVQRIHPPPSS